MHGYIFFIIQCFIQINGSIRKHKIDPELGSTIVLPSCLSTLTTSSKNDILVGIDHRLFDCVGYFL